MFPKPESPALAPAGPARGNTWKEATEVPFFNGIAKVGVQWITNRFNDRWSDGKQTGQNFCSIAGILPHGPLSQIRGFYYNGEIFADLNVSRPDNPADPHYWKTPFSFGGADPVVGNAIQGWVWWGREDQPVDEWLQTALGHPIPAYRGLPLVVFTTLHTGQVQANSKARPAVPNIQFMCYRIPDAIPAGIKHPAAIDESLGSGINPVSALYDFLTHPRAGFGTGAPFHTANWAERATGLQNGTIRAGGVFGGDAYISPVHTGQNKADQIVADYLGYFDGFIYSLEGKVAIGWFPDDGTLPAMMTEITEHDMVEMPKIDSESYADTPSKIAVTCLDVFTDLSTAFEEAAVPFVGELGGDSAPKKIERPWFTYRPAASGFAHRYAAQLTVPGKSGTVKILRRRAVRPDGTRLRPADLIKLNRASRGLLEIYRVKERVEGDSRAEVELTLVRERGITPLPYAPAPDPRVITELPAPTVPDAADWSVLETPPGIADGLAVVLCRRPQDTLAGITVWADDDNNWAAGAAVLGDQGFALRVDLTAALSSAGASVPVHAPAVEASPTLGSGHGATEQADDTLLLVIDAEWLSIGAVTSTAADAYSLGILRGRRGSVAAAHASGAYGWVIRRDRVVAWANALFTAEATRFFKLQTFNPKMTSATSTAKALTFRALAPVVRNVTVYTYSPDTPFTPAYWIFLNETPFGGIPPWIGQWPGNEERSPWKLHNLTTFFGWHLTPPAPLLGDGTNLANITNATPWALYVCSCDVLESDGDSIVEGSWTTAQRVVAGISTAKAHINEGAVRLAEIRPTTDTSGWSVPIKFGQDGTGVTQLRRNSETGMLEETPDGGETVRPMGGGEGGGLPAGAVDGQMIVADSTVAGGVRWTGVSALPAPSGVGAVLVSNGANWLVLGAAMPGQVLVVNQAGIPTWAAVDSITYDPNSGQPQLQGTTIQCSWAFNGDGNGIFYALGTNIRRQAWANPRTYGPQLSMLSNPAGAEGFYAGVMDRVSTVVQIGGSILGIVWLAIDLGAIRQAAIESYSIQGGTSANFPRTWRLQGSNNVTAMTATDVNAATWVDIDVQTANATLTAGNQWGHWASNGDSTTRFRFLRLVVTLDSSAGANPYMNLQELELYGPCTIITQNLPVGTTTFARVTNGDGNGLIYYMGSFGRTKPFSNPVKLAQIAWISDMVAGSLALSAYVPVLFDRTITGNSYVTWPTITTGILVWDFGGGRSVSIDNYTLYQGTEASRYPRNWVLEGTNVLAGFTLLDIAAANWTAIDTRTADTTINAASTWGSFTSNGDSTTRFRYVRWRNTGANSAGQNYVFIQELEFYGTLAVE